MGITQEDSKMFLLDVDQLLKHPLPPNHLSMDNGLIDCVDDSTFTVILHKKLSEISEKIAVE